MNWFTLGAMTVKNNKSHYFSRGQQGPHTFHQQIYFTRRIVWHQNKYFIFVHFFPSLTLVFVLNSISHVSRNIFESLSDHFFSKLWISLHVLKCRKCGVGKTSSTRSEQRQRTDVERRAQSILQNISKGIEMTCSHSSVTEWRRGNWKMDQWVEFTNCDIDCTDHCWALCHIMF